MKKTLIVSLQILFLTAIISVSSCKKEEEPNQTFSYTEPIHEACVFSYQLTGQTSEEFENPITTVTVQQAFASTGHTYDASKIVSAKLTSLKATVNAGNSQVGPDNLDEITKIEVFVRLDGAATDVLVASAENFIAGATSASLIVSGVELKGFITQQSILTVKITNRVAGSDFTHTCLDFSQAVVTVEMKP